MFFYSTTLIVMGFWLEVLSQNALETQNDNGVYTALKAGVLRKLEDALAADNSDVLEINADDDLRNQVYSADNNDLYLKSKNDGEVFNAALDGFCGTARNLKFPNNRLFPTQRWNVLSFEKPASVFDAKVVNASIFIRSQSLRNVVEVTMFHCYSNRNDQKEFRYLNIDYLNPNKEFNNWTVFSVDRLFDDPQVPRLGYAALGYRHQKMVVRGTVPPLNTHLHVTVTHHANSPALDVCTNGCCLQPVMIDFEREGLNFIHKPRKMLVNTCTGQCTRSTSSKPIAGRKLLETFLNGSRVIPSDRGTLCCTPDGYKPVTVLTTTHRDSVYKSMTVYGVSATSCSCKV